MCIRDRYYSCHHHSRAEPYSGKGCCTPKFHPLAQITQMSTDAGLKVRESKFSRKHRSWREFHRTEVAGKKEAPQQTSLELPISTENSCADTAPLVLRERRKGGGTRVISSLEHLPLRYL